MVRKQIIKKCNICEQEFTCKTNKAKYCSHACKRTHDRILIRELNKSRLNDLHKHDSYVPTCKICGLKSTNLSQHIIRIHKMSISSYRTEFSCDATDIIHRDAIKQTQEMMLSERNPGRHHGGRFSSISKNFIRYQNMPHDERDQCIQNIKQKQHLSRTRNQSFTTRKEYWMTRFNMNEDEASTALKKRQTTFSKSICIQRYGITQGTTIWQERQQKWLSTMNSKSISDIQDINKRKNTKKGFSKIAHQLFSQIDVHCSAVYKKHPSDIEYIVTTNTRKWSVDFYYNNKVIEFYGDIWHANPLFYAPNDTPLSWKRNFKTAIDIRNTDTLRIKDIQKSGVNVLIVWEHDYRNDPAGCIKKMYGVSL